MQTLAASRKVRSALAEWAHSGRMADSQQPVCQQWLKKVNSSLVFIIQTNVAAVLQSTYITNCESRKKREERGSVEFEQKE